MEIMENRTRFGATSKTKFLYLKEAIYIDTTGLSVEGVVDKINKKCSI
jgi:hypothetical protein